MIKGVREEKNNSFQKARGSMIETNRQLISTLESMNEGFISLDKTWHFTYMNRRAGEIFERDPRQMIGKNIWTEFPEEFRQSSYKSYEKAMNEQVLIQTENYYSLYDKWYINRIVPTEEGLSIFFQDITKSKVTEAALKRSEDKFNKAFYNAPVAITITRASDGVVLDVNDGIQGISGYKREEVKGNSAITMNAWAYLEDRNRYVSILKEKGRVNNFETQMRLKSGELRNFELSGEMYESDGELLILTLFHDITERKEAEEKLQAREQELSLIFSNVHDAIFYIKIEQDNNFRFLSVNRAFLDLTGLHKDQVINKLVHEIIPEPSLSLVVENYKKCIHQNRTVHWEEISLYPTGKKVGFVTVTPIFDQDGFCTHLIGTVHDITQNKIAAEEIIKLNQSLELRVAERTAQLEAAKEKAESADRLKTSFLANMSHELRTPLNSIIGFTGILLRGMAGPLNEEQKKQLNMVQTSGKHLLSLINDLLDLSKIESENFILNAETFDMQSLIEEVIEQHLPFAANKNISLIFEKNDGNIEIRSDRQRVKQVLINLVNNGVKFTEKGSVNIRCLRENDTVKIEISDTGIGIEEENLDKIFDQFFQIETDYSSKFQGTGLGLAICRKIMEHLHGTIAVKSKMGVGSVFTCTFQAGTAESLPLI